MLLIKKYLSHLALEGKTDNTVKTYGFHLSRFKRWLSENGLELDEVRPLHLVDLKEELLKEGKAERSVNSIISCIKGYYEFLILHEKSKSNPASDRLRIKVQSFRQERLSDAALEIFYAHIAGWKENVMAAFHLMISTGARVGEVAYLRKGDFTIRDGALFVDIHDAKWGSDRVIPVTSKKSAVIVKRYIDSIDEYGLPAFRVSKRTLQTYATDFQEATGIPFSCHVLRHTFATLLLEKGIAIEKIQYMLGHKTPNVTRHYTQSANIDVTVLAPSIWQGD